MQALKNLISSFSTKKRRSKNNKRKYPRRGRQFPSLRKIDYQYLPSMQSMGPGSTTKNFEKIIVIPANTNIRQTLTSLAAEDDLDSSCRQFRYVRINGVCITQNAINLTNQQDNVYVRIAWSENFEDEDDIEKDDASKILPNIGRLRFMFKPPNAQLSLYKNTTQTINPSQFMATEHLLNSIEDSYKIPGSIELYNTTTIERKVRVTLRMIFRGSKVIDKVTEAKRILKKEREKLEKQKKEEEEEKEEEKKNEKKIKIEQDSEEEIYEDEEEEISKWSQQ